MAGAVAFNAVEFGLSFGGFEGVAEGEDIALEAFEAEEGPSGVEELAEEVGLWSGLGFDGFEEFVLINLEIGLFGGENFEGFGGEAMGARVLLGTGLALGGAGTGGMVGCRVGYWVGYRVGRGGLRNRDSRRSHVLTSENIRALRANGSSFVREKSLLGRER